VSEGESLAWSFGRSIRKLLFVFPLTNAQLDLTMSSNGSANVKHSKMSAEIVTAMSTTCGASICCPSYEMNAGS